MKYSFSIKHYHNKIKGVLFAIFSLSSLLINAQDVSRAMAIRAAEKWVIKNEHQNYQVRQIIEKYYNGQLVQYLVQLEPNGFILLSADKDVVPILAYSFHNYAPETINNPATKNWLDNYSKQIFDVITNDYVSGQNRNKWQDLLSNNSYNFERIRSVSPLLATTWNQNAGWNAHCPTDPQGPGGHALAGCVAVAMGQIMKKWNYPTQGTGSHGYYSSNYGYISANFGNTTYHWSSMSNNSPDQYNSLLLYHCGVSVDMNYGPGLSGAWSSVARNAFVQYFNYSSDAQLIWRHNYTDSDWINILKNDLNQGYPIYYRGEGTGAHAFVIDGYENIDYFHINWGGEYL